MKARSISAQGYRGWKTWGPVLNSLLLAGVAGYYAHRCGGTWPVADAFIALCLLFILIQIWWIAAVLKQVSLAGDDLEISGLSHTIKVSRADVITVKNRTRFKRLPSTIVLRSPSPFGRLIRFFPAKPSSQIMEELMGQAERPRKSANKAE